MPTVREIYSKYRIMPTLGAHQLRVAAVATLICERMYTPVGTEQIVLACLFHDMGNIIKSELTHFPEFVKPQGLAYWEKVKSEYVQKYGRHEHEATMQIAREIGLSAEARRLISRIEFALMTEIAAGDSLEQKICEYADMRVGPFGVLPIEERLAEGRKRYAKTRGRNAFVPEKFEELSKALRGIEKEIFLEVSIKPEDITDASIEPIIRELEAKVI